VEELPASELRSLAEKIDLLFDTVRPPGRGPYTHDEVARAIERDGGPTISAAYIWMLRKGQRDNPTKKHLEALAKFFGVSPLYFFDETTGPQVEEQLALIAALRDGDVRRLTLRAARVSSESLGSIAQVIERVQELEQGRLRGRDAPDHEDSGPDT
jgi:transcriptional regulator with XRE-family HTH domain